MTGLVGPVRYAQATLDHLREGDIVLVDREDLDHDQAFVMVAAKVAAVVNAGRSSTGRYPNLGPQVLSDAGITVVDGVGAEPWTALKPGEMVRLDEGQLFRVRDNALIGHGDVLDQQTISAALAEAEASLATRLESLTTNASDHLERERAMLLQGVNVPELPKTLRGRPMVIVSPEHDWKQDLASVRRWIKHHDPVLIGVNEGVDELLVVGLKPHVAVGRLADLSDRALKSGALIVAVASNDDDAERASERIEKTGADFVNFVGAGPAGDLAIVLADSNRAEVIVEVGGAPDLIALLDGGAAEVASTFLTRLRAGRRLVNAPAVQQLSARPISIWPILAVLVVGLIAVAVAIGVTPLGQQWWSDVLSQPPFDAWFGGNQ